MTHPMAQKEPILFDGIEYEWKTLGGIFGLYRKDLKEWPALDVSGYQPKKQQEAKHWVSCRSFTIQADCDESGRIVFVAPIARKFQGQPIGNLLRWAAAIGDYRTVRL